MLSSIWRQRRFKQIYNAMAKILKIQTGTIDVVVTSEFENEDAATQDKEPTQTDVKITEFKVENTKWKKGGLADE
jgi:hypothetical protein